jgi:hypothetical protein
VTRTLFRFAGPILKGGSGARQKAIPQDCMLRPVFHALIAAQSGMATNIKRMSSQSTKAFAEIDPVLDERSYPKAQTKRAGYHVYDIAGYFAVYVHRKQFGSAKLFIDAKYSNLAQISGAIKGVILPNSGTTKNSTFEKFSSTGSEFLTGLPCRQGWKFQFKDAEAVDKFLNVCEAFAANGMAAAKEVASAFEQVTARSTTRRATVAARVGQDKFREKVLRHWKTCGVTGCNVTSILKSSHIKPWAVSDARERLDASNGILLCPNLDSLFDCGLISFADNGAILISAELSAAARIAL